MLIETLAMWLLLCGVMALLAWRSRSLPLAIVSSFGLIITGLQYYSDDADLFVLGMLLMLAFAIPLTIKTKRSR